MKLKGRIALVTGSGQGIGLATLKAFGAEGATLIVSDVVEERAASAAKELKDAGYTVDNVKIDVANKASIEAGFAEIVKRHGRLDIFVNNAGIGGNTPFLDVTLEESQLVVRGRQAEDKGREFLHRGIAARQFQRTFVLADGMEVVGADLSNGLLSIDLIRPEPARIVRRIGIQTRD